jgi:hypothetical protein
VLCGSVVPGTRPLGPDQLDLVPMSSAQCGGGGVATSRRTDHQRDAVVGSQLSADNLANELLKARNLASRL